MADSKGAERRESGPAKATAVARAKGISRSSAWPGALGRNLRATV